MCNNYIAMRVFKLLIKLLVLINILYADFVFSEAYLSDTNSNSVVVQDNYFALMFGVTNYHKGRAANQFAELKYSNNDLRDVNSALIKSGFKEENIEIYTDEILYINEDEKIEIPNSYAVLSEKIDKEYILETISNFIIQHKVDENDLFLVYLTGHGGIVGDSRLFVTSDTSLTVSSSYLKIDEVLERLSNESPGSKQILVVDACANQLYGVKNHKEVIVYGYGNKVADQLYSSKLEQASRFDSDIGNSVFTHYFSMALKNSKPGQLGYNGNGDRYITTRELFGFTKKYVAQHIKTPGSHSISKIQLKDDDLSQVPDSVIANDYSVVEYEKDLYCSWSVLKQMDGSGVNNWLKYCNDRL